MLAEWGLTNDADGLERFALTCVDVLAGQVAVLKPQSAFFERHGSRGIAVLERVLERVLAALAGTGTLSLLDVKRGDIGSTMDGYADAYLALGARRGRGHALALPRARALDPAILVVADVGCGAFILARASNADGAQVQLADRAGPIRRPDRRGRGGRAQRRRGAAGRRRVVVGATAEHGLDLSALNGPVLVPDSARRRPPGRPGGAVRRVSGIVLPSASRSVLRAGPEPSALRDAAAALRVARTAPA